MSSLSTFFVILSCKCSLPSQDWLAVFRLCHCLNTYLHAQHCSLSTQATVSARRQGGQATQICTGQYRSVNHTLLCLSEANLLRGWCPGHCSGRCEAHLKTLEEFDGHLQARRRFLIGCIYMAWQNLDQQGAGLTCFPVAFSLARTTKPKLPSLRYLSVEYLGWPIKGSFTSMVFGMRGPAKPKIWLCLS